MYQAKEAGRGRAVFFQAEMQRQLLERLAMETGMHRALQRSDFRLFYQPIVSEGRGTIGVEALVRWPGEDQSAWISPAEFVPIAEENGLIVRLGDWILRSACEQFVRWRSEGLRLEYVSVNVSVRQLREADFLPKLIAAIGDSGMRTEECNSRLPRACWPMEQNWNRLFSALLHRACAWPWMILAPGILR